jgi:hypothetical protein
MIVGLYRAPCETDKSFLPYAYTCPKPDCVLRKDDRAFVYCNPVELNSAYQRCLGLPILSLQDGSFGLQDETLNKRNLSSMWSSNFRASALFASTASSNLNLTGDPKTGTVAGARTTTVGAVSGKASDSGSSVSSLGNRGIEMKSGRASMLSSQPSIGALPVAVPPVNILSSSSKVDEPVTLSARSPNISASPGTSSLKKFAKVATAQQVAASAFKSSGKASSGKTSPLVGSSPVATKRKKMG